MTEDYERMIIDDTYELILNENPWPVTWTRARKIELINKIIEYYTRVDEFERCRVLLEKKEEVNQKSMKK